MSVPSEELNNQATENEVVAIATDPATVPDASTTNHVAESATPVEAPAAKPAAEPESSAAFDFESALAEPSEGDVVSGIIVHKDRDGALLVDIGAKSEGLVRPNEVSRGGLDEEEPQVGDRIKVVVIGRDKEDGKLLLSKKRADFEKAWDKVEEALQDQRVIHAMVTERVKGGLVVDLGIRGFVPASHVGTGDFKHTNLDKYVGQSIALKVIEVDRDRKKVVLSNKDATREERARQRTETLQSIKEGEIREGTVRRVTDYGAFVDLGGIDGLLHVSEMSWARINHPSDVVKVGDKINVMVLKMRPDQDRISLGLRQILPDPWTEVPGKYNVGDKMTVTVSRVVPFGAFVTLSEGIEAIIPNSELSIRRVTRPTDVVNPGDEVEAVIVELKPDERKMTLSLRRIQELERRETDAAAREAEYQEFRSLTSGDGGGRAEPRGGGGGRAESRGGGGNAGGGGKSGGGGRRDGGGGGDFNQGGRVTLGDIFGEQLGRARKEVSRKGRPARANDDEDEDDEE